MSLFDSEDESEAVVWNPENSDDDEDDIIIDPSLGFSKDELATCLKVRKMRFSSHTLTIGRC